MVPVGAAARVRTLGRRRAGSAPTLPAGATFCPPAGPIRRGPADPRTARDRNDHRARGRRPLGRPDGVGHHAGRGLRPFARPTGWTHSRSVLFGEMLLFGLLSLTAAFVLSYDAVLLAANPGAVLSCDVNTVLSCGTVAQSWQAQVFGFPTRSSG